MPAPRKTRFAILGLLSWQPMSGYDIKRMVEMALSHFWSESYGQLYPTLNQLVTEGLARKRSASRGKRHRHVYSITGRGRREFLEWMKTPADLPRVRNEPELRFFLSSRLPAAESIRIVEEYRDQARERYELFADAEKILARAARENRLSDEAAEVLAAADGPDPSRANEPLIFYLTLRHGVRALEARLAWCDEALRALRRRRRKSP